MKQDKQDGKDNVRQVERQDEAGQVERQDEAGQVERQDEAGQVERQDEAGQVERQDEAGQGDRRMRQDKQDGTGETKLTTQLTIHYTQSTPFINLSPSLDFHSPTTPHYSHSLLHFIGPPLTFHTTPLTLTTPLLPTSLDLHSPTAPHHTTHTHYSTSTLLHSLSHALLPCLQTTTKPTLISGGGGLEGEGALTNTLAHTLYKNPWIMSDEIANDSFPI
ncbi:hypothetical protein Pcinc_014735 [Petrolisthes cinctipes]|uniref:Uncharacterized protein n=1 Tax=Petrolisthes cinctipes TaxID=88211 RepID=A0AAE1KSY6_PETCI|nr:hypothetical protein Pcinc_014735 [Petrolisthes cinctipes]